MSMWARGLGITLVETDATSALGAPSLYRALADGIEHAYEGPLHVFPPDATWLLLREHGEDVGVAVVQPHARRADEALLWAVAIAPEHRGRATATKAILLIERRLKRDGIRRVVARVPRTNGRGLYFMLRVGYTPLPPGEAPEDDADVTWFARGGRM